MYTENADGTNKERLKDHAAALKAKWHAMTKEQQHDYTKDAIEKMKAARTASPKMANTAIQSFHDARATMRAIETDVSTISTHASRPCNCLPSPSPQLDALHGRTGIEALLVIVRGSFSDFIKPRTWGTSEKVENFLTECLNVPAQQFGNRLEAYCNAGIQSKQSIFIRQLTTNTNTSLTRGSEQLRAKLHRAQGADRDGHTREAS